MLCLLKLLCCFWVSQTIFYRKTLLYFKKKSVHNFEIVHKTSLFLVSGAVTLPLKRMKHDPEKAKFHFFFFFFFWVISLLASGFNNLSVFLKEWLYYIHSLKTIMPIISHDYIFSHSLSIDARQSELQNFFNKYGEYLPFKKVMTLKVMASFYTKLLITRKLQDFKAWCD